MGLKLFFIRKLHINNIKFFFFKFIYNKILQNSSSKTVNLNSYYSKENYKIKFMFVDLRSLRILPKFNCIS